MERLKRWWNNDLPKEVKFVFFVLMANALPAITILMTFPNRTEDLFVWTVNPIINVRLLGVMYANALLLIAFGLIQPNWPRVRIIMVVITLFSVLATILTFVYLKPFLDHPWFHLTYWLSMYLILFFAAPFVFIRQEKLNGGRLPVTLPMNLFAKVIAGLFLVISLITGSGLLFQIDRINEIWPWTLPPLVGGLIGVLLITHFAAYSWALWDGDWIRIRPIFWQAPFTALLFILLPLLHSGDLRSDLGNELLLSYAIAGFVLLSSAILIFTYRSAERDFFRHANG